MFYNSFSIWNVIKNGSTEINFTTIIVVQDNQTVHDIKLVLVKIPDYDFKIFTSFTYNLVKPFCSIKNIIVKRNRYRLNFVMRQSRWKQV